MDAEDTWITRISRKTFSLKRHILVAVCFVIFSFATCSPVFIQYSIINKPLISNNDTVSINGGNQKLFIRFGQSHYPGNNVRSLLSLTLKNLSNDTLFLAGSQPLFFINSKAAAVDSQQLSAQLVPQQVSYVLPNSNISISCNHTQQNKKLKEFYSLLKVEELKIKIVYRAGNRYLFQDSIIIIPDLKRR